MAGCDHQHPRVIKFNGGNPVYLCAHCRAVLGYVDPDGPHPRSLNL